MRRRMHCRDGRRCRRRRAGRGRRGRGAGRSRRWRGGRCRRGFRGGEGGRVGLVSGSLGCCSCVDVPRGGVGPYALWATIWDAGCRWKWRRRSEGFENDTEVAAKGACVLSSVSLKRECSRFLFQMEDCWFSPVLPATCIAEFESLKGWMGHWVRDVYVTRAILEGLDGPGS